MRGDGINPRLLGLRGTVSEYAVRLGMRRIEEKAGLDWISTQIIGCISPVLGMLLILDTDVTVKPPTADKKAQSSATTRKNPIAPATLITAISWQTYASASASKCAPAMSMPPPKAYPDFETC